MKYYEYVEHNDEGLLLYGPYFAREDAEQTLLQNVADTMASNLAIEPFIAADEADSILEHAWSNEGFDFSSDDPADPEGYCMMFLRECEMDIHIRVASKNGALKTRV